MYICERYLQKQVITLITSLCHVNKNVDCGSNGDGDSDDGDDSGDDGGGDGDN